MPEWLSIAIEITTVGLTIVFLVLTIVALVIGGLRRLDERWQAQERRAEQAALTRPQNLDTITLILIAAAAATLVGGRHRIRSVRRLLPADAPSSPWSAQGRAVLQGSHILPRKSGRG